MRRGAAALLALVSSLVVVSGLGAPAAVADGDPASDVLLADNVFYPYSPPVSGALQRQLNAETAAAHKARFPIKVALIGSPVDLGVVPFLFGKPQKYANFLDQEISFQAKQPLLVVMPAGYGVQGIPPAAARTALTALKPPRGGQPNDLAQAALTAVAKLSAAAGHPLGSVAGAGGSGGSSATPIVIVLAVAAACVATALVVVRRRVRPPAESRRRRAP